MLDFAAGSWTIARSTTAEGRPCLLVINRTANDNREKSANLINQWQRPAEVLLEDLEYGLPRDVGREDAAVGGRDGVALRRGPVAESILAVPPVHYTELGDVTGAREYRVQIRHGGVLAVQQTKLIVRQSLVLGHDILGQLQQRVVVAPEQLTDRHLDERLDLQDVHDGRHRQS